MSASWATNVACPNRAEGILSVIIKSKLVTDSFDVEVEMIGGQRIAGNIYREHMLRQMDDHLQVIHGVTLREANEDEVFHAECRAAVALLMD